MVCLALAVFVPYSYGMWVTEEQLNRLKRFVIVFGALGFVLTGIDLLV
jgi:hypothetical protein